MTAITSKYTGEILGRIQDETKMGRWSGFNMATTFHHTLHVVTAYQSVQ
jgi:hypothetical protein